MLGSRPRQMYVVLMRSFYFILDSNCRYSIVLIGGDCARFMADINDTPAPFFGVLTWPSLLRCLIKKTESALLISKNVCGDECMFLRTVIWVMCDP